MRSKTCEMTFCTSMSLTLGLFKPRSLNHDLLNDTYKSNKDKQIEN